MKRIFQLLSIFLCVFFSEPVFSQQGNNLRYAVTDGQTFILHKVAEDETLFSLAEKYKVSEVSIVNNNSQLVFGLKVGMELKIPVESSRQIAQSASAATQSDAEAPQTRVIKVITVNQPSRFLTHTVKRRETLSSIAKKYDITIDDILKYNQGLTELKRGDRLRIPQWDKKDRDRDRTEEEREKPVEESPPTSFTHKVIAGETLLSISKKYDIPVESILEQNSGAGIVKPGMNLMLTGAQPSKAEVKQVEIQEEYINHTIVSGETPFSLSRKYNITAEALIEFNPSLDGSFKTGTVIRVPKPAEESASQQFNRHVVGKHETVDELALFFRVSSNNLKKWNPFLEYRDIIEGDTIRVIPGFSDGTPDEQPAVIQYEDVCDCVPLPREYMVGRTYHVVMFLPLMIDSNMTNLYTYQPEIAESDTLSGFKTKQTIDYNRKFYGSSENFLHFYEGALLAADSLQNEGLKIKLTVYDTSDANNRLSQLVASGKLDDADLFIGPVHPADQKEIAAFAQMRNIPVISPLSAVEEVTRSNPCFFQINTSHDILQAKEAEYIAETYRGYKIIFLETGISNNMQGIELMNSVRKMMEKTGDETTVFRNINFRDSRLDGLRAALDEKRKNVIILSSQSEADVRVGLSNIYALAPKFDIVFFGNYRFPQYESINPEHYHDGQMEYLSPYWVDYKSGITKAFVSKFRNNFKTEPNQYSNQGYDVVYYFVKALDSYGNNFLHCIPNLNVGLIQGNYSFVKTPGGGFINESLNVISYTKDYQVVRKKVID
ncbi:MAG: LysM peptidoglycan-binding domain-containing protein [Prolixibacteraceae bacterium]|nr:LysM peptidoglycan-binding domain-containing protein [Prolixibacteraceae bacterium]